jgi:hypothetical protein
MNSTALTGVWLATDTAFTTVVTVSAYRLAPQTPSKPDKASCQQDSGHRLRNGKIALPEAANYALRHRAPTQGEIRGNAPSREAKTAGNEADLVDWGQDVDLDRSQKTRCLRPGNIE